MYVCLRLEVAGVILVFIIFSKKDEVRVFSRITYHSSKFMIYLPRGFAVGLKALQLEEFIYIERGQNASTFLAKAEKFLLLSNHRLTC